jgi:hypothetical protein
MVTEELRKAERDLIVKGLEEAYRKMVEFKKQKNSPLIICRNGQVEAVDPNDMPSVIHYKRSLGS